MRPAALCTARCCPRTPTRPTGSPTACSPPGVGRPGCRARPRNTSRWTAVRRPPCWSGCAARSRRSSRRCGSVAYRSRWSGWAACWTPPRYVTWSARCGSWPTRPMAPRCCGCSPAPVGGSGHVTWWRCTGGPGPSRTPGDRSPPTRPRRSVPTCWTRRPWWRRWPTSGRRRRTRRRGSRGCARTAGSWRCCATGWIRRCRTSSRTSSGPSAWTWRSRCGPAGTAPATRAWPGAIWTRSATWRPGSAGRRPARPCPGSCPTWPPPRTRSAVWRRARSRWWRARCRWSPRTPPRAWSGTSWRWPGSVVGCGRGRSATPTTGWVGWACCRSRCAATPTGCPSWRSTRRETSGPWRGR
ncbi:hypothetical protein ONO86_04665 [Micromonospora noduli]|nr:hypothetical protein ONO86_04665 [Micromonospora noduli]